MKNWGVARPAAPHWLKWVTLDEFQAARPQDSPDQVGPPVDDAHREGVIRHIISATELCRQDARSQQQFTVLVGHYSRVVDRLIRDYTGFSGTSPLFGAPCARPAARSGLNAVGPRPKVCSGELHSTGGIRGVERLQTFVDSWCPGRVARPPPAASRRRLGLGRGDGAIPGGRLRPDVRG